MSLGSSFMLYLMLGAGVAGALFVREGAHGAAGAVRVGTACLFWPLYVPLLLAPTSPAIAATTRRPSESAPAASNPLWAEIARVEVELDGALRTLDGWAEGALSLEGARFDELKHAWRMQAERIGELADLLSASSVAPTTDVQPPSSETASQRGDRRRHSERARRENIDRLRELHGRMQDDLRGNLAWVRELVTLIHLAKYTGAPASRAEELVAQIAAAVEGLSEVSDWRTSETEIPVERSSC